MSMNRALNSIKNRVLLLAGKAILIALEDGGRRQRVQISALAGETRNNVESIQPYGFHSNALSGADVFFMNIGGNRDHPVAICIFDPRHKPNWAPGESGIYDHQGQKVHLRQGNIIDILADTLNIKAQNVNIEASAKVSITSPLTESTGDIIDNMAAGGQSMANMRAAYNSHTHNENDAAPGPTGTPNQPMGGA